MTTVFRSIQDVGVAIIGQTSSLAPADNSKHFTPPRYYRDGGLYSLRSPVALSPETGRKGWMRCGRPKSAAARFMPTYELSEAPRAEAIVGIGKRRGVRTTALLQPI